MIALDTIIDSAIKNGEAINLVFEERLVSLINALHGIAGPLNAAGIDYELIGGLAVLVYVEEADPDYSMLTGHVDILINRDDLERVIRIASSHDYSVRDCDGSKTLIPGQLVKSRSPVHLLLSGERVHPAKVTCHPRIAPMRKNVFGEEVNVIRLADLLEIKLSAFRLKDRVHVQVLDAAGLITPEVEEALPEDMRVRLKQVRESE